MALRADPVTKVASTVEAPWQESATAPLKYFKLPRQTFSHRSKATGQGQWSETFIVAVELGHPFGCGTLVSTYREDHWVGWAKDFHGFPLPWRGPRMATVTTSAEVALLTEALGTGIRGPIVGGGPDGPMTRSDLQRAVAALMTSCGP